MKQEIKKVDISYFKEDLKRVKLLVKNKKKTIELIGNEAFKRLAYEVKFLENLIIVIEDHDKYLKK